MKNLIKEYILAIVLIALTLVLICCASKPKEVIREIPVPVVAGVEGVYFPAPPYPKDGIIMPLDENGQVVVKEDENIHINTVVMPFWYWKLVLDYISGTEAAVTALQTAGHPP